MSSCSVSCGTASIKRGDSDNGCPRVQLAVALPPLSVVGCPRVQLAVALPPLSVVIRVYFYGCVQLMHRFQVFNSRNCLL